MGEVGVLPSLVHGDRRHIAAQVAVHHRLVLVPGSELRAHEPGVGTRRRHLEQALQTIGLGNRIMWGEDRPLTLSTLEPPSKPHVGGRAEPCVPSGLQDIEVVHGLAQRQERRLRRVVVNDHHVNRDGLVSERRDSPGTRPRLVAVNYEDLDRGFARRTATAPRVAWPWPGAHRAQGAPAPNGPSTRSMYAFEKTPSGSSLRRTA